MQDSGSLAVFKVTARDQGHYKGPSGAFVTYCNISCFFVFFCFVSLSRTIKVYLVNVQPPSQKGKGTIILEAMCFLCSVLSLPLPF